VIVRMWGTRGSISTPGPETIRYGGNTSCVEVRGRKGELVILDAGTGIRRLGEHVPADVRRIDILLTHLHMDHIQGLGFFGPLYDPRREVHIWGPASTTMDLRTRLMRYLSPPLFPVMLRDIPSQLHLHEVPCGPSKIGDLLVTSSIVCHPGPTVGYRISVGNIAMAYMPDHEPALGTVHFPVSEDWTSGASLAQGVDLLVHDGQYTSEEYRLHVGWGHSSVDHALEFAAQAKAKHLVLFHHDPSHDDTVLSRLAGQVMAVYRPGLRVSIAAEGDTYHLT
jgi:phosphoribosyl 1,2-cyclic phosphodiesterase